MARLGFRTFNEMIGRSDLLDKSRALNHWKANGLNFTRLFYCPEMGPEVAVYNCEQQDHHLESVLDRKLIEEAKPALDNQTPVQIETSITNVDRAAGAMLSGEVALRYGHKGLPDDTIHIRMKGTSGQSFGAFAARGVTLELEGEANDYVGKGLSGGRIAVYPALESKIVPEECIIVGNTVLYGAISGECYFRGVAGERFAVRNSGAHAVVEGLGDHGCEYMTGGVLLVIGPTGRNFAAGMSGGVAYVLDSEGDFERRCNLSMVELEPVTEEDDALEELEHQGGDLEGYGRVDIHHDMTRFDAARIRHMLERHLHYTDSDTARDILHNWVRILPQFVKVMPVDYRRALSELQAARMVERAVAAGE